MLYAALKQDSATVALDILTYNDLELLRGKKTLKYRLKLR